MLLSNRKSIIQNAISSKIYDPFTYKYKGSIENGYKETIIVRPRGSGIFSSKYIFDIRRNGLLAQCFLKFTLSSSGDNTLIQEYLATRVCSYIAFETKRGPNLLQNLTPQTSNARFDNLPYNLYTLITQSSNPDQTFNNNTISCYLPLFLFISEDPTSFIDTDIVEDLQLTCITNEDYGKMGLAATLSDLSMELHLQYYRLESPRHSIQYNKLVYGSYEIVSDYLTSGDTTFSSYIYVPYSVYCMHVMLVNDSQEYHRVESFTLNYNNNTIVECQRRSNYSLWSQEHYNTMSGALTYWFSLNKTRLNNTMCINMKDLDPLIINCSFDAISGSTWKCYLIFEYWALLNTNKYGFLNLSNIN